MSTGCGTRFGRLMVGGALVTSVLAWAPSAAAVTDVQVDRLAGGDRFETAATVATAAFPSGAADVILANGRAFPDALAGAALAGAVDAPILLTEADALPAATKSAIEDLGGSRVHIVGGPAAVSGAVESALEAEGLDVVRIAGRDRYETAGAVAQTVGADDVASHDGRATALIATGDSFADALAGGPLAGRGTDGVHPILLVSDVVPASTAAALDALGIDQVIILGGTDAVSSSVEANLERRTGNPAIRLAGDNRYATAVAVAEATIADFDFGVSEVLLASGATFADALAGGPLGAVRSAPIVLTPQASLASDTRTFLEDHAARVERLTVLGGDAAVSEQAAQEAETASESTTEARFGLNETIMVDPVRPETVAIGQTRSFTAEGMESTPVDIVLLECGDVRRSEDGNTVFTNTNVNGILDRSAQAGDEPDKAGVDNVHISSVNGVPRSSTEPSVKNNDYVDDVAPQNGSVTFIVSGPSTTSTATVCVVPVVFVDVNGDDALNGGTTNPAAPTEQFGTGGRTTWAPGGAAAGQFDAHNVDTVTKSSGRFTACKIEDQTITEMVNRASCKTFLYDATDVFEIGSHEVDPATWEAALSRDDDVRGTYAPDGKSVFNLHDEGPRAVTAVQAQADPARDKVVVAFDESETTSTASYRLHRLATDAACPAFSHEQYRAAVAQTPDSNPGRAAHVPHQIGDAPGTPGARYCYVVVPVDELGDEGIPSESKAATWPS